MPIKTQAKERLGDVLPFCYSIILPDYFQESSWRTFFLRGKRRIDSEPDIQVREALPYDLYATFMLEPTRGVPN